MKRAPLLAEALQEESPVNLGVGVRADGVETSANESPSIILRSGPRRCVRRGVISARASGLRLGLIEGFQGGGRIRVCVCVRVSQ